jgi:hypothetical protein
MRFSLKSALVLVVSLFLVLTGAAFALPGDNDWRPVTPEELAMKTAKVEAGADAEALFWEVRIDDSSSEDLSMQHYVRVKVFTDKGLEKFSKLDVPFSKRTKIKDLAARVIKADGSIVEIARRDIVEREIIKAGGVKIKAKSVPLSGLERGSIVEYRYREAIDDAGAVGMHLKFQRDIPVQTLSYYYKPYNKTKPNYQSFNFDPTFDDTTFVEHEKGFWVATRKDVPAFREEPRMPPEDQVIPWMLLQTVRFNFRITGFNTFSISIKDPSNPTNYWGAVGRDKSALTKLIIKPNKEIKKAADEITAGAQTDDEKLKKLYQFCQTQINNTSFDTSLTDEQRKKFSKIDSPADVLKNKNGDSGYVDLLFGALASSLGYETRVAFSADRSQIFFHPDMTNEGFIHAASIALKVGSQWKFFNPGLKFLPYGMLIWYEEDVWAYLVGEKEFTWTKVPLTPPNKSAERRKATLKLLEDGTLEGDVRIEYTGQPALVYRVENYDDSANQREENLKEDIKRRMSTADVSDIAIDNLLDGDKPLVQRFKIRVPQYAQKTGKRLFIQPSFFQYGAPMLFSSGTRKYDVYFRYPWSQTDEIEIELPKGFGLDNAERPAPFAAQPISEYKISMGITTDNRSLVVRREFFFGGGGHLLFTSDKYAAVKNLFDLLHKNDEHTVPLKSTAAN